jgi:hypothetical protein
MCHSAFARCCDTHKIDAKQDDTVLCVNSAFVRCCDICKIDAKQNDTMLSVIMPL